MLSETETQQQRQHKHRRPGGMDSEIGRPSIFMIVIYDGCVVSLPEFSVYYKFIHCSALSAGWDAILSDVYCCCFC